MKSRNFSTFFMGLLALVATTPSATSFTYVVKKGNSLSKIAGVIVPGLVWGRDGSLKKVLALNPEIKDPNFILPGQVINMDFLLTSSQESCSSLERVPASEIETKVENKSEQKVEPTAEPLPQAQTLEQQSKAQPQQVQVQVQSQVQAQQPQPTLDAATQNSPAKRGAFIAISPRYSLSSISAKDKQSGTTSTLATKYNVGAGISYIQEWSSDLRSFYRLNFSQVAFEQPTDSTRKIVNSNKFLSGIALGLETDLSSRSHLQVCGGYQKELFARATSTLTATVDAVAVPFVGGKIAYDALNADPFALGVSSEVLAKMPVDTGSYKARLGAQYTATIYTKQKLGQSENYNFEVNLGISSNRQNTSITQQNQTAVTLGLRFLFPVGRR